MVLDGIVSESQLSGALYSFEESTPLLCVYIKVKNQDPTAAPRVVFPSDKEDSNSVHPHGF